MPKTKPKHKLTMKWSKRENDLLISYPRSYDGHLLHTHMSSDSHWSNGDIRLALTKELAARGYDLTTLKFSIELPDEKS